MKESRGGRTTMATCAMWDCLRPIDGMAMICDQHRKERVKECREIRSRPNYQPNNPACTYGPHNNVLKCACLTERFRGTCKPCTECHYCGQKHTIEIAA